MHPLYAPGTFSIHFGNDYAGSDDTQFDEESFISIRKQEEQAGPSKRLRSRSV